MHCLCTCTYVHVPTSNKYLAGREGVQAKFVRSAFPTKTFPNHFTIVTVRSCMHAHIRTCTMTILYIKCMCIMLTRALYSPCTCNVHTAHIL